MRIRTPLDYRGREGRLRPEAIARCGWAPSNVWLPASTLAHLARQNGPAADERVRSGRRTLPEEAFEFRGGSPEFSLSRRARTRWADTSASGRKARPAFV